MSFAIGSTVRVIRGTASGTLPDGYEGVVTRDYVNSEGEQTDVAIRLADGTDSGLWANRRFEAVTALAIGDRVKISPTATSRVSGGHVDPRFQGAEGTVTSLLDTGYYRHDGSVQVRLAGGTEGDYNWIHPTSLTKIDAPSPDQWQAEFAPKMYRAARDNGMCHEGTVAFMAEHGLDKFLPVERIVEVTYRVRVADLPASASTEDVHEAAEVTIRSGDVTRWAARTV
jgi:hypothetical protein